MEILAPVADVLVALLLLLLAYAALTLLRFITSTFQGAPFPIDWVVSHVVSAAESIATQVKRWAVLGIDDAVGLLLAAFDVSRQLFDWTVEALEKVVTLGAILRAVALTLYHQAETYTQLVADGIAASVIATTNYLEAQIAFVAEYATVVSDDAARSIASWASTLTREITAAETALTGAIDAGVAEAERYAASSIVDAERYLEGALATAVGTIDGAIAGTERDVVGWVETQIGAIDGAIDGAKAEAALGISAAVAGILSYIQAGVLATVATINAELDECVRPNCGILTRLRETLTAISTDVEILVLLAFLAQCVADPGAAATEIETVVDPIATAVYSTLGKVLSL